MFKPLIEALRGALDEGPEGHRLKPFSLSAEKIRQANEKLKQIRRDTGGSSKPDVNTKHKLIARIGASSGDS